MVNNEKIKPAPNFAGGGRNLNIEILRIVSMIMIIIGHTIGHSRAINEATGFMYVVLNTVYILILPAVNVYVLISGYFSINAKWNFKRILLLWLQVFFYSIIFYVIAVFIGITQFSLSGFIKAILPISGNQYWFARVFWCFSLFVPFEAILLNKLRKKQYQFMLVLTLIIFSLWRSFLPFSTTVNAEGGGSIIWFFVLFAFAGYLKLHCANTKPVFWSIVFIISSVLTILSFFVLSFVSNKLGFNGKGTSLFTEYTSITMIAMSVSLFMIFATFPQKKYSDLIKKIIVFFSTSTYSVYLIHENKYVKQWLWSIVTPQKWVDSAMVYIYIAATVLMIFVLCLIIDAITWKQFSKLIKKCNFSFVQNKIDNFIK